MAHLHVPAPPYGPHPGHGERPVELRGCDRIGHPPLRVVPIDAETLRARVVGVGLQESHRLGVHVVAVVELLGLERHASEHRERLPRRGHRPDVRRRPALQRRLGRRAGGPEPAEALRQHHPPVHEAIGDGGRQLTADRRQGAGLLHDHPCQPRQVHPVSERIALIRAHPRLVPPHVEQPHRRAVEHRRGRGPEAVNSGLPRQPPPPRAVIGPGRETARALHGLRNQQRPGSAAGQRVAIEVASPGLAGRLPCRGQRVPPRHRARREESFRRGAAVAEGCRARVVAHPHRT